MSYAHISYLSGFFILILSGAMIPPFFLSFGTHDALIFLSLALGGTFIAGLLIFANKSQSTEYVSVQEAFILTTLVWIISIIIGALPLYLGSTDLSVTDAIFQSTSIITTTGAHLIPDLEYTNRGILLWCSILQWLGGKGIILMGLMVMPFLRIGGVQLLHTETSNKVEKFLPRVTRMAALIFLVYVILTLLCAGLLWGLGFSIFDAFCHALTTLSTGGFSTWNDSIQHADSFVIQIIITFFMYLGGCTFFVLAVIFSRGPQAFWKDPQIRTYSCILIIVSLMMTFWRYFNTSGDFATLLVESFFNVTSAMTTTGYVSADYSQWGGLALITFFFLPFIGGCTGSTAGGIKVLRFQILWRTAVAQLKKLRRRHGVFDPVYHGEVIPDPVLLSVMSFFFLFVLTFVFLSLLLGLLNMDFLTSVSGVVAAITNLGPGLGDIIGPSGTYDGIPDVAKWILATGMLLGRIELVAILVLMMPSYWRS